MAPINPSTPPCAASPAPAVPEGFRPRDLGRGFIEVVGPLYYRRAPGTDRHRPISLGFRVEQRHCNPAGTCHGGMLATFVDMLLPVTASATCEAVHGLYLPTISLQVDYLAGAPLGSWLQGDGELLRATRNMVFVQGLLTADGTPVARASGIFKVGPALGLLGRQA